MGSEQKQKLIDEFFAYKVDLRRRPRHIKDISESSAEENNVVSEEPEKLNQDWLQWMTPRQVNLLKYGNCFQEKYSREDALQW